MVNKLSSLQNLIGILPNSSEEQVLRLLVQVGVDAVGGSEGSVLLYDKDDNSLQFAMTYGDSESEQKLLGQKVPMGKGLTGLSASTLEVQIGAPTFSGVEQAKRGEDRESNEPESVIAAPMTANDQLIGVMTAVSHEKGKRFNAKDGTLYMGLATIAGLVISQNQRLSLAGLQTDEELQKAGQHEAFIVRSVARLTHRSPEALQEIASILGGIEALISAGGSSR